MAQEIKLQAIPPGTVLFRSLVSECWGLRACQRGAGGWLCCTSSDADKKSAPWGQEKGAGMDQKPAQTSAGENCCCLRGLTLFPSTAHTSFVI